LLREREACLAAGIAAMRSRSIRGLASARTLEHSLALLRESAALRGARSPLLVGVSRKSVIGRILGRRFMSACMAAWAWRRWR
jgi:dihydropteroate synthase